jgi:hypothetical protein
MTTINFKANDYTPESTEAFKPLPNGEYACRIDDEAVKPTKSGDGYFLEIKLEVMDGAHKGRKVLDRINLKNPNEKAVQIGLSRLSAICHALNLAELTDTNQLLNQRLMVSIGQERDRITKEPTGRNSVFGYSALASQTNHLGQPFVVKSAMDSDIPF